MSGDPLQSLLGIFAASTRNGYVVVWQGLMPAVAVEHVGGLDDRLVSTCLGTNNVESWDEFCFTSTEADPVG